MKTFLLIMAVLVLGACRTEPNCPPPLECPLPDEGTEFCPGCDDEQVEVELEIE